MVLDGFVQSCFVLVRFWSAGLHLVEFWPGFGETRKGCKRWTWREGQGLRSHGSWRSMVFLGRHSQCVGKRRQRLSFLYEFFECWGEKEAFSRGQSIPGGLEHENENTIRNSEERISTLCSRMRSKGSRFTLGVWGLWVCSLDVAFTFTTVRNRPQPFATVRNRPQPSAWGPYGRAYGKFCKRGHFWRFQASRCFVSCGRRGTSWHSHVFCNVSKVVLCGRRNTFATFSQDELQFSWQAQHFGRARRHFAWQAQQSGLRQMATSELRGRRGVLWDVMKIDGSLARNIDFGVANLEVHKKTRRKISILKLQSVKIGGSLPRNARFDAPTCLVSSLWLSCGLAVSMGEAAKPFLFEGVKAGCYVVLCGRRGAFWHTCLITCRKSFCVAGAEDEMQFSWQARSTLYALHSTL